MLIPAASAGFLSISAAELPVYCRCIVAAAPIDGWGGTKRCMRRQAAGARAPPTMMAAWRAHTFAAHKEHAPLGCPAWLRGIPATWGLSKADVCRVLIGSTDDPVFTTSLLKPMAHNGLAVERQATRSAVLPATCLFARIRFTTNLGVPCVNAELPCPVKAGFNSGQSRRTSNNVGEVWRKGGSRGGTRIRFL
jgi:hypothetical protein